MVNTNLFLESLKSFYRFQLVELFNPQEKSISYLAEFEQLKSGEVEKPNNEMVNFFITEMTRGFFKEINGRSVPKENQQKMLSEAHDFLKIIKSNSVEGNEFLLELETLSKIRGLKRETLNVEVLTYTNAFVDVVSKARA